MSKNTSKHTTQEILQALEESVAHWNKDAVEYTAGLPGGAGFDKYNMPVGMNNGSCSLCVLFDNKHYIEPDNCAGCPLDNCTKIGSTFVKWANSNTNAEAYLAAVAMRDRLIELRDEYRQKVEDEKPKFKVGDRVKFTPAVGTHYSLKGGETGTVINTDDSTLGPQVVFNGVNHWMHACQLTLIPPPEIEVGDVLGCNKCNKMVPAIVTQKHEDADNHIRYITTLGTVRAATDKSCFMWDEIKSGERMHHTKEEIFAALGYGTKEK